MSCFVIWHGPVTVCVSAEGGLALRSSDVFNGKDAHGGIQIRRNLTGEEGLKVFIAEDRHHGGNTQERTETWKSRFLLTQQRSSTTLPRGRMSSRGLLARSNGNSSRLLAGAMIIPAAASVLSARLNHFVGYLRTAAGKEDGESDDENSALGDGGVGSKQPHGAAGVQLQAGPGFLPRLLGKQVR
ncbi:hypothetical protein CSUI_003193 [Cystoisospora suis]|uniref:Uncharacterized protein n=1 Tax=Cystoisospora suis TaxID=483139 RepID=A0A2C6L629_9APIC|nr:hypothetical protein CSUI_003193 [Cystoisospora suis]